MGEAGQPRSTCVDDGSNRWAAAEPDNAYPVPAAAFEASLLKDWKTVEACCRRGLDLPDVDHRTEASFCLSWGLAKWELGDRRGADGWARNAIMRRQEVATVEDAVGDGHEVVALDLDETLHISWLLRARCAFERGDNSDA